METIDTLDADITDLQDRIATLHAQRANLTSILLSQPHLPARLQTNNNTTSSAQRLFNQQATRNAENIHRACASVTAYKVQDPDPYAANNGHILGISIDVSIQGRFVETYHILLSVSPKRSLRVHKHTIPPCIPLQQLANKYLPISGKDGQEEVPEQDLVRFGRAVRKELTAWHLRTKAVEEMKKEANIPAAKNKDTSTIGQCLNAFVSEDEESEDGEDHDEGVEAVGSRIKDIEADAAVRQITVTWTDRKTVVMSVTKDGRVEKAVSRAKDGSRDAALSRKAVGPLTGLLRRLMA